jgi:prepilin-type N-terminal cleavage/methylation domain-containing protein
VESSILPETSFISRWLAFHTDTASLIQQIPVRILQDITPLSASYLLQNWTESSQLPVVVKPVARSAGFTLVEIMIVVAIIALLAAIAVPGFLRARKRSQATSVKNDLRLIDDALAQYAMETGKSSGDAIEVDDWIDYIKDGRLYETAQDVLGDDYGDQVVDALPTVPANTWDSLSDVADAGFWSPYTREGATPPPKHRKRWKHGH